MGRRALPKISQACDVSQHLLELEALTPPFDADQVFSGGDLEIEVGSGKGLFLTTAAAARPERRYLGIEIARKYAHFIAARLTQLELANARVLHGNAEVFFRDFLGNACCTDVHVYFPDPWWKKRHHKRRIMNEKFLEQVHRVLRTGGTLHFWTDVRDYFDLAIKTVERLASFDGPHEVPERPAEHDLDYQTHFERRTRMHGEPVYRAIFRRTS